MLLHWAPNLGITEPLLGTVLSLLPLQFCCDFATHYYPPPKKNIQQQRANVPLQWVNQVGIIPFSCYPGTFHASYIASHNYWCAPAPHTITHPIHFMCRYPELHSNRHHHSLGTGSLPTRPLRICAWNLPPHPPMRDNICVPIVIIIKKYIEVYSKQMMDDHEDLLREREHTHQIYTTSST